MKKELTPLEALNELIDSLEDEHLGLSESEWVVERKQIIETALKDYEKNKELLKECEIANYNFKGDIRRLKDKAEQNAEKLKALEIVIKKEVNVQNLKLSLEQGWTYEICERYCQDNNIWEEYPPYKHSMTEEEYEMLKEVLL